MVPSSPVRNFGPSEAWLSACQDPACSRTSPPPYFAGSIGEICVFSAQKAVCRRQKDPVSLLHPAEKTRPPGIFYHVILARKYPQKTARLFPPPCVFGSLKTLIHLPYAQPHLKESTEFRCFVKAGAPEWIFRLPPNRLCKFSFYDIPFLFLKKYGTADKTETVQQTDEKMRKGTGQPGPLRLPGPRCRRSFCESARLG